MIRVLALLLLLAGPAQAAMLDFTPAEVARILRHGPWPPPTVPDPSNRVDGSDAAAALGAALFFDRRLSGDGGRACASCHDPARGWGDGLAVSKGRRRLERNAPSLANVRLQRWFGWDGAADSLWAASLAPILAPDEMAADPAHVAGLLRGDARLASCYARAFARSPEGVAPLALAVDAAKALAAFQARIETPTTAFDRFRDALAAGRADADYPLAAQRGLRLFVGRGNCALCHLGPAFTNGEFHDIGVPFFTPSGADSGRYGGIARLRASAMTLLGPWNDDPLRAPGVATRHVAAEHRNFGEFRTPGLRDVAGSAPYMHNGGKATLRDVIRHYSTLDPDRLHAEGEAILAPLHLADGEIDDLLAFLETLSAPAPRPAAPGC